MSNPLAAFRKHQKILLVVFGIALMLTFTVGTVVSSYISRNQNTGQTDEVVVEYDGGEVRESEMQLMRFHRKALLQFFLTLQRTALERGGTPLQAFFIPQTSAEVSLLQTKLMADEARKLGMDMEKDDLIGVLNQISDNRIKSQEYENLLQSITQGRMSPNHFFSALKDHLLSGRYQALMTNGFSPSTPAAFWDFYQRINRRVEIEAVAYPAADYLSSAPEPSASEVEEVYESGKHLFSAPSISQPGFKKRKELAVAYIKADMEPIIEIEKAKVTDEEIAEYYEANKSDFRNVELPSADDLFSEEQPSTTESEATDPADQGDTSSETVLDEEVELDAEAESETVLEEEAPVDSDPSDSNADESDNGCGPQESEDEETEADSESDSESPSEDAITEETSTAEVEETSTSDESEPTTEPANEATDEGTADDQSSNAADDVNESTSTDEAGDAETADEEAIPDSTSTPANEDDFDSLPDDPAAEKPEFKPIEEVSDDIRLTLARQRVGTSFEQTMNEIESKMRTYFGEYIAWNVTPEDEREEQPTPPNLAALASEAGPGFEAGEIPLVNIVDFNERNPETGEPKYEISTAYELNAMAQQTTISQVLYGEDKKENFEVNRISGSVIDTYYLFWVTKSEEEKVQELEDCRDQVVETIKLKSALEEARKAAESQASQLNGRSLKEVFGDTKTVVESGQFSWLTLGYLTNGRPQLSQIPGIQFAGNGFMRSVFDLKQGEAGVAINNPETIAYLVYIKSDESNPEGMRTTFFQNGLTTDIATIAFLERSRQSGEWYQEYEDQLNVKWLRTPLSN